MFDDRNEAEVASVEGEEETLSGESGSSSVVLDGVAVLGQLRRRHPEETLVGQIESTSGMHQIVRINFVQRHL